MKVYIPTFADYEGVFFGDAAFSTKELAEEWLDKRPMSSPTDRDHWNVEEIELDAELIRE